MPKEATKTRRKLNFDEEDANFIPKESAPQKQKEKTTDRKTVRKEFNKPSEARLNKKPGVQRARKRTIHVIGRQTSMYEDLAETAEAHDEEEIRAKAPPPKNKKLMADAMTKKPSSPKNSATAREATEAVATEAARNSPTQPPQLKTRDEQMSFLVSTIQGMEKKVSEILPKQKSLERIVETKFHDVDVKVMELTTTIQQLQHEVDPLKIPRSTSDDDDDDDSPLPTTTQSRNQTRSATMAVPEARPSSSAQAAALAPAPPTSTPPTPATSNLYPACNHVNLPAFFDASPVEMLNWKAEMPCAAEEDKNDWSWGKMPYDQAHPAPMIYDPQAVDFMESDPEEIVDADEVEPRVADHTEDEMLEGDLTQFDGSELTGESLKSVLLGWPDDDAESSESRDVGAAEDSEASEDVPSMLRRRVRRAGHGSAESKAEASC
ncbi:putative LRR receptor-like serine/threonine-protein kinase [Hordeum vulgare]|nr:putative LRR receptor-like serine/threonine-protein kinase [Hordeum vulgare]